ncbi:MAG: META domain-containing protein [Tannerellaceae bacterium]|jgi:heat shock protein HslJ|nr:META domain-containing protein [Tannerellaceae bacterium]MBP8759852.1 META domain-containing protein [Parabacteroides sp.]MBP9481511.1 META domain-containing protein [Parabacteroides sp.]MBP9578715.1 META domain-containing protein [Parabacteroides sp.]MDD2416098.1 META domain-containing protein [Parabacteroides sp.]
MKKGIFLFLFCLPLFCSGCKSSKEVTASFSDLDGEWNVVEMNNKKIIPEVSNQFITFEVSRKRISGNAGCNRFSGGIEYADAKKNSLRFQQIVSTRMACQDMSGEMEMFQALDKIVRFEPLEEGRPINSIALYSMDGNRIMIIGKR